MATETLAYTDAQTAYNGAPVTGAAIIVRHPDKRRIFWFEECNNNFDHYKVAGMKSFVMETAEPGESSEKTRRRAMREEANGMDYVFDREQGYYHIGNGIWARVSVVEAISDRLPVFRTGPDAEQKNPEWIDPHYACDQWTRRGVREMLEDFILSKTKVGCHYCEKVDLVRP